jgi:Ca-activated chloride channel homolog
VIQVIEDFREYIKKPTNVILVVDTSGSMNDSNKLPKAKTAIASFINNITGKRDRLGMITFSTGINYNSGAQAVSDPYKSQLLDQIKNTSAGGNTAILDSVLEAYNQLQKVGSSDSINAIVVMTDGQENASTKTNQKSLVSLLSTSKVPIVVFAIAFGKDADTSIMKALADATKGQFRTADSFNIDDLYKIISTYF